MKKMKNIKTMNELLDHKYDDLLVEMARINDKKELKYDVFVNGGNSYGTGNEHGEPHFHFSDNIKNSQKFDLSILIPTKEKWEINKELIILDINNKLSWIGLRNEKSELIEWLDKPNCDINIITNIQAIRFQWNVLNKDNKNVKQIEI